jgi:hypothetical protein
MSEGPPQDERLFDADDFMAEPEWDDLAPEQVIVEQRSAPVPAQPLEGVPREPEPSLDAETVPPDADEPGGGDGPLEPEGAGVSLLARHVRRRRSHRTHRAVPAGATGKHSSVAIGSELVEPAGDATGAAEPAPSAPPRIVTTLLSIGRTTLSVVLIIALLMASLYGLAVGINAFARWNARRIAALNAAPASPVEDNLLVIGVTDGVAVGFAALKAERADQRVLGIAIPDGSFMEVPGQGFERVGSSYVGGPGVSMDTVSNYLGVPFRHFVVIDGAAYQTLLTDQSVSAVMSQVTTTDLTPAQRTSFTQYFAGVTAKKGVWIAPLPVKQVTVGDEQYFEPQRAEVADLLLQWWGVQPAAEKATPRVIVYNGVGTPGLAGLAAQQLIKAGLRVVDSGNADNFNHQETLILLYHGTAADAAAVRTALGVGRVVVESAPQDLTDMIVIIGADYRPPTSDASTVPTEGVQ